ncbi:metal-dependent transcriptional regulator [Loigolactobacillus bifermentans]|jgi:DtxR family Mn-dependent transcriptional regulator|uniref:Manganese transport regulator n=1 Tax=Loigolactobacillus bifermentans DSM 20003 TaxID=1423726 RepID=A0A0R1H1C3_9LACO|nr:metal-dependent transcriptional regulator [Loigolactobacillus bifermentans]KRK40261.1 metal-dependent regulator [Loigolactobacillus bifermentans DSM 20003]QGG61733.1 metal-dependent transcriptional regulator [Loigolactobacillus bifermentans]
MTPIKEDYLKIIFELGGAKQEVSNKQIALALGVAAGSVTEMVSKLKKEKLVTHQPYNDIALTKKGLDQAILLIRKHRLWETFLAQKLEFKLADIHSEAEVLEHATSPELLAKLDAFLGFPTHCPHGGVIPDQTGHFQEESYTVLNQIPDGQVVTIERVIDDHELLIYLQDIQLKIERQVKVLKHEPFDGPIAVEELDTGRQMNISFKASHNIFVTDENGDPLKIDKKARRLKRD